MTRTVSPRLVAYLVLGSIGLLAGVLVQRIDAVVLATPFVLAVVAGLGRARDPVISVKTGIDRHRAVEGEDVDLTVEVSTPSGLDRVEVVLDLPAGLAAAGRRAVALRVRPGATGEWTLPVRCERWGTYGVGALVVRVRDSTGLFTHEQRIPATSVVKPSKSTPSEASCSSRKFSPVGLRSAPQSTVASKQTSTQRDLRATISWARSSSDTGGASPARAIKRALSSAIWPRSGRPSRSN